LLLKSFVRLQNVNPGFNPEQVSDRGDFPPSLRYPDKPSQINFFAELDRGSSSLPG
jgi:hypothetical protein